MNLVKDPLDYRSWFMMSSCWNVTLRLINYIHVLTIIVIKFTTSSFKTSSENLTTSAPNWQEFDQTSVESIHQFRPVTSWGYLTDPNASNCVFYLTAVLSINRLHRRHRWHTPLNEITASSWGTKGCLPVRQRPPITLTLVFLPPTLVFNFHGAHLGATSVPRRHITTRRVGLDVCLGLHLSFVRTFARGALEKGIFPISPLVMFTFRRDCVERMKWNKKIIRWGMLLKMCGVHVTWPGNSKRRQLYLINIAPM